MTWLFYSKMKNRYPIAGMLVQDDPARPVPLLVGRKALNKGLHRFVYKQEIAL
jgi:hypothetical protein